MENIITERTCTKCGETKALDSYSKARKVEKDGRRAVCKACEKKAKAAYYKKNREEIGNKNKKYLLENRDKKRDRIYRKVYGITLDEYNAMYKNQEGRCDVCGEKKDRLHVDHNHATNKVRGLLCNGCNAGLGQLKESVAIIERLKLYVIKHS